MSTTADIGINSFTFSVYSHSGDWKSGNTVQKGYGLNNLLQVYQATSHAGSIGKRSPGQYHKGRDSGIPVQDIQQIPLLIF